MEKQNHLL